MAQDLSTRCKTCDHIYWYHISSTKPKNPCNTKGCTCKEFISVGLFGRSSR